jgi:hypothetical protein
MPTGNDQQPQAELAVLVWTDADGELDAAVYADWASMEVAVERGRAQGCHDFMTFTRTIEGAS